MQKILNMAISFSHDTRGGGGGLSRHCRPHTGRGGSLTKHPSGLFRADFPAFHSPAQLSRENMGPERGNRLPSRQLPAPCSLVLIKASLKQTQPVGSEVLVVSSAPRCCCTYCLLLAARRQVQHWEVVARYGSIISLAEALTNSRRLFWLMPLRVHKEEHK